MKVFFFSSLNKINCQQWKRTTKCCLKIKNIYLKFNKQELTQLK